MHDRPSNIPLLILRFCQRLIEEGYTEEINCTSETMQITMDCPWSGNIRELKSAIEYGVIYAVGGRVMPESIPQVIQDYARSNHL